MSVLPVITQPVSTSRRGRPDAGCLRDGRAFARLLGWVVLAVSACGLVQPAPSAAATSARAPSVEPPAAVDQARLLRLGVLRFGTVNWELDVMQRHGFARARDVQIDVVPLASKSALSSALINGQVDVIVGDWLWVSSQRHLGNHQSFVPYSMSVGSLVAGRDVSSLADLRGQTIGVAGGPTDKSWLLLRAHARKTLDQDLEEVTEQVFAPAPLLNELLQEGRLAAVITNWNYAVRLNAGGFDTLVPVSSILPSLGIDTPIPLLGWIFDERWANEHTSMLGDFFAAAYEAKERLGKSDEEWERLGSVLGVEDSSVLARMRAVYRAGIPREFTQAHVRASARALQVLNAEAGRALDIVEPELARGTFWSGFRVP